jgi:transcriptional regulator with XRE-family HTH domain
MTDTKRLREKIDQKGLKLKYLAEQLKITPYALALKINNKNEFKPSEIKTLCEVLEIDGLQEKEAIFFA